ncbi:preprotein translocase subunit SecG [Dissulfurirhabdus thermomarina]|uniref:Protein-export membrane protein SecG n=1 Tax=Dissulfurirhabdus thermomarina TaxID=1765737 RepID=A0A6N9TMS7_DISTH|nr:preprotein translocase subunit SecG [Dissulfurirhabdus thermomarina]NDY41740.1 preprotein translocase subunit SecG [Dissulfurirhabdus thermomarina]NMX23676.1 preprotein translocase subunit SecG [Dissulfurirhabdus thermomarina]
MYAFVITIHVVTCILLVLIVLLQKGKGAEVGAVFGSSEAMFGSAGPASFLHKLTTVLAAVFMVTSITLTYLAAHRVGGSVMEKVKAPAAPASPVEHPAAPPATK